MKNLRDFSYKRSYTRGIEDPLKDFLIPVLKLSNRFYYISGYFSSKLITLLSYGIKDFIANNKGKIKLVVGQFFSKEINVLNMSKEELGEKFSEVAEKDFFSLELEKYPKKIEPLKLLAWLLYNNRIKIKWGIPIDPANYIVEDSGILHEKIGILCNKKINPEDYVTFSGSANATYYAWLKNREEMKVFLSWKKGKRGYAIDDRRKFKSYWKSTDPTLEILDFPVPLKKKIIEKYLPRDNEIGNIDFDKIDELVQEELKKEVYWKLYEQKQKEEDWIFKEGCLIRNIETIKPYPHQERALDFLNEKNYVGFLEMATGSGKTKIAVIASYRLHLKLKDQNQRLLIIISVPDSYLVDQWFDELADYTKNVIKCYSDNPKCPQQLITFISRLKLGKIDHAYIVGTTKTLKARFWAEKIIKPLQKSKDKIKILFISDEAHTLGAPTGLLLIENISDFLERDFKIGLSATPYRQYDTEGTKIVLNFLCNEEIGLRIFPYKLKQAQDDGSLMRFNYFVDVCNLSNKEFEEFKALTEELAPYLGGSKKSTDFNSKEKNTNTLTILLNKRADIIKKSEGKIIPLEKLLKKLLNDGNLYHTVIFARDGKHVIEVEKVIRKINQDAHLLNRISYNTVDGEDHNDIRLVRFNELANKDINVIIAMNCLNQGVNIPSLSRGIFLSSSGTDLEHIQRAGRLLRIAPNKIDPVELYDYIIFPTSKQIDEDHNNSEQIFDIEKKRLNFFQECAENQEDIQDLVFDLEDLLDEEL